ncbi:hypothetical protein Bca101_083315 [Brassica carinata]
MSNKKNDLDVFIAMDVTLRIISASIYSLVVQRLAILENLSLTVRKRGSQRDSSESIFHLDEMKLLFHLGSWILVDFQILSVRVSANSSVHFKFLRTTMIMMMDRFTGEVVDAYYLEMDNDDDKVTEDDDEDAKGGR